MNFDPNVLYDSVANLVIMGALFLVHKYHLSARIPQIVEHVVHTLEKTGPAVTTEVAAAVDAPDSADRDAHLKAAALLGIQALGYDALALSFDKKAEIASFMASHLPDSLKSLVTPDAVEGVLNGIKTELDALKK